MTVETENREEVFPCRVCASPVFDDEIFCEACGARLTEPDHQAIRAASRGETDRDENDLGGMASITDRGNRPRNEDAMGAAAADGRFVAVVCDGVASTANPDLAAQAAATAALAVLEPLLHSWEWPENDAWADLMGRAFQ